MSVEAPSVSISNAESTAIPQLIPMKSPVSSQRIQQPQQQIVQAVNANTSVMNASASSIPPKNNLQMSQSTSITMVSAPPVALQQQQMVNTTDTTIKAESIQQTQEQSEQTETLSNVSMQSTPNRKRSREQMLNEEANNLNIQTPPNASTTIPAVTSTTPCEPPTKKMKLSDNAHAIDPNSEAFDENPYISATNNNNSNNNTNTNDNDQNANNGPKVLQRNHADLKRYLNAMDEESLKYDLFPKLALSHKDLFESVRQKMNENLIMCKIFIRSLSYETEDKTVHDAFLPYGTVKEAVIVKDRQTGKSRGFGFITMSNAAEAQAALVDNRKTIDGREVICNLASKPQGQKTSTDSSSKRGDSFRSDHRGSPQSSRSKRSDSRDRNTHSAPTAYAYAPTANPYAAAYDYNNYSYPAAAAANAMAMNPYGVNPYAAMNPYAQYAQVATAAAATQQSAQQQAPQQQNTNNAAPANIGPQPYAPTTYPPGFAAMPYRFN